MATDGFSEAFKKYFLQGRHIQWIFIRFYVLVCFANGFLSGGLNQKKGVYLQPFLATGKHQSWDQDFKLCWAPLGRPFYAASLEG